VTVSAHEIDWGGGANATLVEDTATIAPIAERFPLFCARLQHRTRPADIIPDLVPGMGLTMVHGQPRSLKSWTAQEIGRAVSTGDAAFGLERFRVEKPQASWYLTDEGAEIEIRDNFTCLFAGRQQSATDLLHVTVQKAILLDDLESQVQLTHYGKQEQIRLTIFDPIRSMSAAVDQGPRELRPLASFLRFYMRETGSAVLLVHHDVKPVAGKPDDRARPHRASGGGIFSIADSPIHAELIDAGASQTLLAPSNYKFAVAPDPFIVELEADDPKRPKWVRIQGKDTAGRAVADVVLHQRIAAFLREHPGTSGNQVATGVRGEKGKVLAALDQLFDSGQADYYQKGQGKYWTMRPAAS
jgi:hypothetical protein